MNYPLSLQAWPEILPDVSFSGKENVTEGIFGRDTIAIVKVNGRMGRRGEVMSKDLVRSDEHNAGLGRTKAID